MKQRRKATIEITDFDIAVIEALHDLLLDHKKPDNYALRNAQNLIERMYEALEEQNEPAA